MLVGNSIELTLTRFTEVLDPAATVVEQSRPRNLVKLVADLAPEFLHDRFGNQGWLKSLCKPRILVLLRCHDGQFAAILVAEEPRSQNTHSRDVLFLPHEVGAHDATPGRVAKHVL